MNIRLEITISSDELEIINLIISLLKTKVFRVVVIPGGFIITSYDGVWPDNLESQISEIRDDLNIELADGIKPPSFKRIIVTGFPRIFG